METTLNFDKAKPCHYCAKPVEDSVAAVVYLAHSNGGAYGWNPAHVRCHEGTPCRYCGIEPPKRNDYGYCKECGRDHEGYERDW